MNTIRSSRLLAALAIILFAFCSHPGSAQCPADVNGDGLLTPGDFTAWIQAYNRRDLLADQNADNQINPADFQAWIVNWNAGCDPFDSVDLTLDGTASPALTPAFIRPVPARSPDGTEVAANEPRYDGHILRVPVPVLDRTFSDVFGGAIHLGAGYSASDELVQFHALTRRGGQSPTLQASHGVEISGGPGLDTPANARRYNLFIDSMPEEGDWTAPAKPGDTFRPGTGEYYQDAWFLVSEAVRSGRTGVAISVGNYTPEDGLSGNSGLGTQLTTVFCDLDMQTTSPLRVREWSTSAYVLRNDNEIVFTAVDYAAGSSNESWAVMVRATRPERGAPWTFQPPVIALERAGTNLVDHFHNFGLARNSTTGLVTAFISTGDVIDDQAVYVRSIADLSDAESFRARYAYNGRQMTLAFAETPSTRWSNLDDWAPPIGVSSWTETRNIFGRRVEDGDGESAWGAPQFVGSVPGPKRSQVIFGADVTRGHGIYCYDVDTFDPLTESPYPEIWQRWGNTSQFGFIDSGGGVNIFKLYTPRPEVPEWYVGYLSQTNFMGSDTPNTLIVGRATPDDQVVFSKVAQRMAMQTFAMTDDGKSIFTGIGIGQSDPINRLRFLREPELVRPRLIGAGYAQYQPLYAAGPSQLGHDFDAGADQVRNALVCQIEDRPGINARFATDEDLSGLADAGFQLPGYGPVYFVETDGSEASTIYLSDIESDTLPICSAFNGPIGTPFQAKLADGMATAELLVAVLNDPRRTPARALPWRFSFGDGAGIRPGIDYRVVPLEGCDWIILRLPYRGDIMESLRMRVTTASEIDPGDVPVSFFMQVIGVSAGDDQVYPIGYAGPPNSTRTTVAGLVDTPTLLPNEVQRVIGLPDTGTVVFHGIADPHGVDVAYYRQAELDAVNADHAFFSITENPDNSVELGWRNGATLYAKVRTGGSEPRFIDMFQASSLQRQDDLKVAVRYDASAIIIDVWHNGARSQRTVVGDIPVFSTPEAMCGDPEFGRSIPMQVISISSQYGVLSNEALFRVMQTGEHVR
ncbi:MAG: GC-type dockerin domain-anchored protein [Planctomycetota bacterium]